MFKNSWFYEKWLRFSETWIFNCMRSKCIFCNFELISSARSVDPSYIFGMKTVYAFVNVRATIVMIRIEVFGLEYVYSVILYFAIASPNSKWPSCSLSAKSQVARFKNFTFRDGKIISKGTGLAPLKILLISRNWQRI